MLRFLVAPISRLVRFAERAPITKGLFVPEQLLSRTPQGRQLFDFTVRNQRLFRNTGELFKRRVDKILTKYGITDEKSVNQLLTLVEFPYYNKRLPTYQELSLFPKNVVAAARDHLRDVTDPIWRIARKYDPEVGYVPGYFTHFPVRRQAQTLEKELRDIERTIEGIRRSGDTAAEMTLGSLEAQRVHLRNALEKIKAIESKIADSRAKALETTLAAQKFGVTPLGGYFGPLDESRVASQIWGYSRNYRDVMHDYIDGAMRKAFLDKWSRTANALARSIDDPAIKQYAYDYITAQRGALGTKTRLYLNSALQQLFPALDAESGGRLLSGAVDFATRMQYLAKIGLSWFRFPLVNITQPLLATYPIVGERHFIRGFFSLFNPETWKTAERVGVVFEPTLRRAVTEYLGRGATKVEKVLTYPAEFSEKINRVWTFASGLSLAKAQGLKPHEAIRHAINLVNRTQFLYHPEAMPLATRSPLGRLVLQFRTFTANYVNYLSQLWRTGTDAQKIRALGTMAVLSGSSALPLWSETREGLLRTLGIDIGEYNPIEFATESLGLQPGINIGTSLEPWNFPYSLANLLGPTLGPIAEYFDRVRRRPEQAREIAIQLLQRFSPPVFATVRGIAKPEVEAEPSATQVRGRIIGRRPVLERLYLRPTLESQRRHYTRLIANAIVGRREDLIRKYLDEAERVGISDRATMLANARRMATQMLKERR